MTIHLTYISQDLRAVTRCISADGSVTDEVPLIFDGDHYGALDDPELVVISSSTDKEGVYYEFAQGRDPDGAPAYEYVKEVLLSDPRDFYNDMVRLARHVPEQN